MSISMSDDKLEDDFVILGTDYSEMSDVVLRERGSETPDETPLSPGQSRVDKDPTSTEFNSKHKRSSHEWDARTHQDIERTTKHQEATTNDCHATPNNNLHETYVKAVCGCAELTTGGFGRRYQRTESAHFQGERTHSVLSDAMVNKAYISDDKKKVPTKKHRHVAQRRSRSTKATLSGETEGSRSTSSSVDPCRRGGEHEQDTCCSEGQLSAVGVEVEVEGRWSETSLQEEIRSLSGRQPHVFADMGPEDGEIRTSQHQRVTCTSSSSSSSSAEREGMTSRDDAAVTSALSDLIGGLDSQIRALCRNLESLAARRRDLSSDARSHEDVHGAYVDGDDEEEEEEGEEEVEEEEEEEEAKEGLDKDEFIYANSTERIASEEDRFFDCISPDQDRHGGRGRELDGTTREEGANGSSSSSSSYVVLKPPLRRKTAWRAPISRTSCPSLDISPKPPLAARRVRDQPSAIPRPRLTSSRPKDGGEATEDPTAAHKDAAGRCRSTTALSSDGTTGVAYRRGGTTGRGLDGRPSSPSTEKNEYAHGKVQPTRPTQGKTMVRAGNTRSMPQLVTGPSNNITSTTTREYGNHDNDNDQVSNLIEISGEHNNNIGSSGSGLFRGETTASLTERRGGGAGRPGGGGGGGLAGQELRQMVDQWQVLWAMWNNHKRQLKDVLTSRERETARVSRLNDALSRSRHIVTSLRQQRHALHQHVQTKEQEFSTTLRCHRNETAYLRKKVLNFLDEKKTSLMNCEPKADSRLAILLDSLLSVHVHRERYLALDLAKQNKAAEVRVAGQSSRHTGPSRADMPRIHTLLRRARINELKLLVVRQQLAIEELKEHNSDLNHALSTLMQFLPDRGTGPAPRPNLPRAASSAYARSAAATVAATSGASTTTATRKGLGLSDVLQCEHSMYLPHHPSSPELATVAVFGIGGEQAAISTSNFQPGDIFDASRQWCHPYGDQRCTGSQLLSPDNISGNNLTVLQDSDAAYPSTSSIQDTCLMSDVSGDSDVLSAQELLHELTLHGPGSADFTLADVDR